MSVETMAGQTMPLAELLADYRPYPDRTWDEDEAETLARECMCCGQPGHYQEQLEAHIREHGLTEGICLGKNGVVWDGHHRILAARRLGIETIPLESEEDSHQRWLRDHGPVNWHARKTGDRSPWESEWREKAARGDFGPDEQAKLLGGDG